MIQAHVSNRWGRRLINAMAAVLLILENAVQPGSVHIAMFLVGRYIIDFGGGMFLVNTPVYLGEISPTHSQGLLVAFFTFTLECATYVYGCRIRPTLLCSKGAMI